MKKYNITWITIIKSFSLLIILVGLSMSSCKTPREDDFPHHQWPENNESVIEGSFMYTTNPISMDVDSVLCLHNVKWVYCCTYNSDYCSYLTSLFSNCEGLFYGCPYHQWTDKHTCEFVPDAEMLFYPIHKGKFISSFDSLGFAMDTTIIPIDANMLKRAEFSIIGDDHMCPCFISDTTTLSGERIICFEGVHGTVTLFQ